jgi:hypothetical protein
MKGRAQSMLISTCHAILNAACMRCGVVWAMFALNCPAQILRVRPTLPARARPALLVAGSLTVAATPATIDFALSPRSTASGSAAITITTSWSTLTGTNITVNVYGYFSSTTSALTNSDDSTYTIPPSSVFGVVGGTGTLVSSNTAFTQTTPFGGASGLELATQTEALAVALNGDIINTLNLQIDLSALPQLPAGTYSGTLNIAAQAM